MKIKVMIDANVLIYLFIGSDIEKEAIKKLFEESVKYRYVTTTRIIDEVIFKLMVINSGKKLKELKKDKALLRSQKEIVLVVKRFLKDFNFKVYQIEERHYWRLPTIIEEFGLLGNDALTMSIMKENNLKYIATTDRDFEDTHLVNIFRRCGSDDR